MRRASPPPSLLSAGMSEKVFIDANELFVDSYRLARKIFDDGFRPDYVVGVWRGGCPIGVAVEEFLRAHPAQWHTERQGAHRGRVHSVGRLERSSSVCTLPLPCSSRPTDY